MRQGPLIILSGPSGAGKSTLIVRLLEDKTLPLRVSISATTRAPRRGEVPGVDYHFLSREGFEEEVRQGAFLEWAEVHGEFYGTLRTEVASYLPAGVGVILVIDVQGAAQVRRIYPQALSLFLRPPSLEVLEQRLRFRGTEEEMVIQRRLEAARREMERMHEYDHILVSDLVEASVAQMHDLIASRFTEV
jgi:guanylate kinase